MPNDFDQRKVDDVVRDLAVLLEPLPNNRARLRAIFEIARRLGISEKEVTSNPDLWTS
jgi:hypothetical protein